MYIVFLKILLSGFFFNSLILGFSQSLLAMGTLIQIQPQLFWFVVSEVSTQTVLSPLHVFCALFLFTCAATGYAHNAAMGVFFLGLFWAKVYIGRAWSWDYVELISLSLVCLTVTATHGAKTLKTILALFCLCQTRFLDISSFHFSRSNNLFVSGFGATHASTGLSPCLIVFFKPACLAVLGVFRAKYGLVIRALAEHVLLLVLFTFFAFRLFY